MSDAFAEARAEIDSLEKRKAELDVLLPKLELRREELKIDMADANKQLIELNEQADKVASNISTSQAEFDEYRSDELLKLDKERSVLKLQISSHKNEVQLQKEESEALAIKLTSQQQALDKQQKLLQDTDKALSERKLKLEQSTAEFDKNQRQAQQELNQKENMLKQLEKSLADRQQSVEEKESAIEKTIERSSSLKSEAQKLFTDNSNRQRILQNREQEVQQKEIGLKQLVASLDSREKSLKQKEVQLNDRIATARTH